MSSLIVFQRRHGSVYVNRHILYTTVHAFLILQMRRICLKIKTYGALVSISLILIALKRYYYYYLASNNDHDGYNYSY